MVYFNIKIFCLFGILIISILALDYIIKFFIYFYFKNNKNIVISKKLPNKVYAYLTNLKIISGIENFDYRFFIINFIIYLIILFLLITILILL